MDVIEVNKMNLANEKAIVSDNNFIREAYKYNYFLQVVLTAVNGVTLKKNNAAGFDSHADVAGMARRVSSAPWTKRSRAHSL